MRGSLLALALCSSLAGCPSPFVGSWDTTWTVLSADGLCANEVGEVSTGTLTVLGSEQAGEVVVLGMGDNEERLDGATEGKLLLFGGAVSDGGGTTTTSTELTIADDGASMSGTERWSWESAANPGACPNAESSVEATRER